MDAELAAELAALRRGRGVQRTDPRSWIGPRLTQLLADRGAARTGDPLRRALIEELRAAVSALPPDLAAAYLAANAVNGTEAPLLRERLELVGDKQGRHPRTMQRRLAQADELMAAALVRRDEFRAAEDAIFRRGWHLDAFSVELRLDLPRPVHRTRRRIRVTAATLAEVTDVFGLPPGSEGGVRVEASEGCSLIESVRVSDSLWRSRFRLPRVLQEGETHAVGISIEVRDLAAVEPLMIMAPVRPCREFRCRVVVGASGAHGFERIDGIPALAVQDPRLVGDAVPIVDGVVDVRFPDLSPGVAYGLRWVT